jgi:hypothetical protein
MALATVTEVKTFLSITGATFDALLADLLKVAERRIAELCNRKKYGFDLTLAMVEHFDGEGASQLILAYTPIASVASVKSVGYDGEETTLDAGLYTFDPETGVLGFRFPRAVRYAQVWSSGSGGGNLPSTGFRGPFPSFGDGFRNIKVTYAGGYERNGVGGDELPATLRQAAIEYTAAIFQYRQRDPSLQAENLGAYGYTMAMPGRAAIENYLVETLLSDHIRRSYL